MKSVINIGSFIIMIVLTRLWIEIDQYLLPANLLMPAFLIVLAFLLFIYFLIVKPDNVKRFAFSLSAAVFLIAVILTIIQHVLMLNDFSLVWKKALTIWIIILILPNLIGLCYFKYLNNKLRS